MSLQLHVFSHDRTRPSISYYCQKLETYLRAAGYKDYVESRDGSSGPKGKWPWVTLPTGEDMGDTYFIIRHLISSGTVKDIDMPLTPAQRADARAWVAQVDELICPVSFCVWFLVPQNYAELKAQMFGAVPRVAANLAGWWMRRGAKVDLVAQGVGRHSEREWEMILSEFIANAAAKLGNEAFLFGREPCSADVVLYAWLVSCLEAQGMAVVQKQSKTLKEYVRALTKRWFPEYDDILRQVGQA
ncbi:hypothetical protein CALCODRAFT_478566 [Calocera cornea HHB12733]|uniref:Thioredoxin-like fold domain-containing protein n=1 Tax=Calocera cornea HHB12733 TaxID=1353952 RepID=A0A165C4J9_9BASI|nr:hypothetical protein CALCODRAFT_478566 [Calocera cornea HHB12733]